jgi:hypothetical protein
MLIAERNTTKVYKGEKKMFGQFQPSQSKTQEE